MGVLFANRIKTTLSVAAASGDGTLTLASAAGLPAIGSGAYCYLSLCSADQTVVEVVKATAISGSVVTVTRAQEGTAAAAWAMGTPVELRLTTAGLLDALSDYLSLTAGGTVAGTVTFSNTVNASSTLILSRTVATTLAAPGVVQIGLTASANVAYDRTSIQARNNGAAATLTLQPLGGDVAIPAGGNITVGGTNVMTAIGGKEPTITAGSVTQYWRGDKSWQTLDKSAVGLGNVDNTSDANKPVSTTQQTALNGKVSLTGDTMTGNLNFAATKGFVLATPGTTSVRVSTLTGVNDWGGFFLGASFSGTAWNLDDTTKNGWFFKLDARANTGGVLNGLWLYRIPTGANPHSDETPKFGVTATYSYLADGLAIGNATQAAPTAGYMLDVTGAIKATNIDASGTITQGGVTLALSTHNHAGTYEPVIAAGTTAQYWRGDKSWQTLNTAAVPESGSLYYTDARAIAAPLTGYAVGANSALAATDTILAAFGKVQGQLNAKEASITAGTTAQYWRGDKSWQTLNSTAVGLGSVENKSSATIRGEITSSNVTTALGFTPANSASLAAVATSGSATDLSTGTLASARLPVQGFTIGVQGKSANAARYPTKAPYAFTATSGNCSGTALVAATASTVYTIKKGTVASPTTIGTFTFGASGTVATVSITAGSISAGDTVWIEGPATADTTLADIAFLVRA